jgi:hypothetical protein
MNLAGVRIVGLNFIRAWVACCLCCASVAVAQEVGSDQEALFRRLDEVLKLHVHGGQVDYPGIAGDQDFSDYIELLADSNPSATATRAEQLAFWINAYNALAIKGILDGKSPGRVNPASAMLFDFRTVYGARASMSARRRRAFTGARSSVIRAIPSPRSS